MAINNKIGIWTSGVLFLFFLLVLIGAVVAFKNAWTSLPAVTSLSIAGAATFICLVLLFVFLIRQKVSFGTTQSWGQALENSGSSASFGNSSYDSSNAATATTAQVSQAVTTAVNLVLPGVHNAIAARPSLVAIMQAFPDATSIPNPQKFYLITLNDLLAGATMNTPSMSMDENFVPKLNAAVPALAPLVSSVKSASANLTSAEKKEFLDEINRPVLSSIDDS